MAEYNHKFVPVDAAARQQWLLRLEVLDKVKGDLMTALANANPETALEALRSRTASSKGVRRQKDINKFTTGLTALHLAALFGDNEVVDQLLAADADLSVTCYCQIQSHSVSTKFWMDARPLLFAVGSKNLHAVEQLLAHGAAVTMNDAWPLFSGEWWNLTGRFDWDVAQSILKMLVAKGLRVDEQAAKVRWSFLHYCANMAPRSWHNVEAFLQGRYETTKYLLKHGADPLCKDSFGRTPYVLLDDRPKRLSRGSHSEAEEKEFEQLCLDANERMKELFHEAMKESLEKLRRRTGIRGSFQKFAHGSYSTDQLPLLLRTGGTSIRSFSLSSMLRSSSAQEV